MLSQRELTAMHAFAKKNEPLCRVNEWKSKIVDTSSVIVDIVPIRESARSGDAAPPVLSLIVNEMS